MFAETILRCSQASTQSELIALAWVLRNRAEHTALSKDASSELDATQARQMAWGLLGDIGLEASGNGASQTNNGSAGAWHGDVSFQQALACVSLVFDGLVPDPTSGANRVHLHDQAPDWSQDCESAALIGSLLFLRADQHTLQKDHPAQDPTQSHTNK